MSDVCNQIMIYIFPCDGQSDKIKDRIVKNTSFTEADVESGFEWLVKNGHLIAKDPLKSGITVADFASRPGLVIYEITGKEPEKQ